MKDAAYVKNGNSINTRVWIACINKSKAMGLWIAAVFAMKVNFFGMGLDRTV